MEYTFEHVICEAFRVLRFGPKHKYKAIVIIENMYRKLNAEECRVLDEDFLKFNKIRYLAAQVRFLHYYTTVDSDNETISNICKLIYYTLKCLLYVKRLNKIFQKRKKA